MPPKYVLDEHHSKWVAMQQRLWKARAGDYSKLDWVRKQDFMDQFLRFCDLKPDWSVLDVGTGPGVVAAALSHHVHYVTGLDITPEMVEKARANHQDRPNITFVEGDAEALALPDNSFDLIVARMVFHHIDDCHTALLELQRTLKPGGTCVICEGVPPDHLTRQRYEEIFALKEERHTFSEAQLINMLDFAHYEDITLKPFFMRCVSLNNWLDNAALPPATIAEIRRLHMEADDHFKRAYRLFQSDGDILMDWKFVFIKGRKPAQ